MVFKNEQWMVTDFGIEAIRGAQPFGIVGLTSIYEIPASRLLEITDRGENQYYDWPVHMAEKTWINIELFTEAFMQALKIHKDKYKGEVDQSMLEASLDHARRIAGRRKV